MPGFAAAICNAILNELDGSATWTPPAALYMALGNRVGNVFTELVAGGGSYARTLCTSDWGAAANGVKANDAVIESPQSDTDYGECNAVAIFDAATGGNLVGMGALTTPQNYDTGVTFQFAVGALEMEITPGASLA